MLFAWGKAGWGDELLSGLLVTLEIALAAYVFGTAIGLIGALCKISGIRILASIANLYSTVFRALPDILVILFLYFSASLLLTTILNSIGVRGFVEVSPIAAAIIALAIINGAYFTEIIRGALIAVPRGQYDAAKSLGLSRWLMLRLVILPQVAAIAVTPMGNMWVIVLKDTALASVIGAREILYWGGVAGTSLRMPFTFYLAVVILYLFVTGISGVFQARIERSLWMVREGASA
jgi:His/Glu/Gln/Arg/opine family amino acid ABC transporter permease subunit